MKLKKVLFYPVMAIAISGIVFSCKKSNSTSDANTSQTEVQTQSDDQARVSTETDAVSDDVNTTMTSQSSVSGSGIIPRAGIQTSGAYAVESLICDASVTVDTSNATRVITITYNGSSCNLARTRTGVVTISIPAGVKWSSAGAVVTVSIQNLAITRILDGKTLTINGTHTYTNVSGGSLVDLQNNGGGSVTHTVTSSDMTITFDNGAKRSWSVDRQRVYTYNGGFIVTETGLHTDGTTTGIVEWGTNRYGNTFETVISQPLVVSQVCLWRITAGQIEVIRPAVTISLTLGLDSTGTPTDCPGNTGTYYFELVWTGAGGKTVTYIAPY